VHICVTGFFRPANAHLYVDSIEHFSVSDAKCYNEEDRDLLKAKVAEYYVSERAFEDFAKLNAIGLIACTVAKKAIRKEAMDGQNGLQPWIELAERLGFTDMVLALQKADPNQWRDSALAAHRINVMVLGNSVNKGWHKDFEQRIQSWFENEVCSVLFSMKQKSMRPCIV
jgi:hypothetical protein